MLQPLLGKQFSFISRAADMLCLFIGEDYTFLNRGKEVNVSEFALHFQTQWRFVNSDSIILGSRDIYEPYNHSVPDDWDCGIIGHPHPS